MQKSPILTRDFDDFLPHASCTTPHPQPATFTPLPRLPRACVCAYVRVCGCVCVCYTGHKG